MASTCKGNMEANNVQKTEESARFSHFVGCSETWHGITPMLFVFEYRAAKENRVWKRCAGTQSLTTPVSASAQGDTRTEWPGNGQRAVPCICVLRGSGS